ncbi:MAG: creatininase family protein [Acidobacteria bacterium]|nr:creatininase family protein [Acidobacteriota bacterium]
MLLAAGVEPGACGYDPEQVEAVRKSLVEHGVHQELPAAEHLGHLLFQKGWIDQPRLGEIRARLRPEVEKLRFHSEKSPLHGIPVGLRWPLYERLLEHAQGAVRRVGRQWVEIDLEGRHELDLPYPFDPPPTADVGAAGTNHSTFLWGELTWPKAEQRLHTVDMALLPVGAIEQHGPHLPLDTDAFDAEYLARKVAEATADPKPLVLPLIPYGVSYHHDSFRGTLSITNDTLARLVYEIGMSAAKNGISKLLIINGHGGNGPALHYAAQMINRDARIFTCVDSGETSDTDIDALAETYNDAHAGEIETSTTLAVRPQLVDMSMARSAVPRFSSHYLDFSSARSVGWYARTDSLSESGVLGDPEKASAEKGTRMWQVMIDNLVELVEHVKDLSLEEIHQRRY